MLEPNPGTLIGVQNLQDLTHKLTVSSAGSTGLSPYRWDDAKWRKETPLFSGVLNYFHDALVWVSRVSFAGNQQHNPGEPLHWARSKSTDEADAMLRHLLQVGTLDTDGVPHSAKLAWRALALCQKDVEKLFGLPISKGSRP